VSFNEEHQGHEMKLKREELTLAMIDEVKHFNKNSSVIQIKNY